MNSIKYKLENVWYNLNYIDWVQVGLICTLVIVVGMLVLIAGEFLFTEQQTVIGVVVWKEYTPSKTGVGVGSVNTGEGSGPVVIVSTESEKWVIVLDIDGDYRSVDVPPELYYAVEEGNMYKLNCNIGKIFHSIISCSL